MGGPRGGRLVEVHRTATRGFDRGAADYERGRPGYAPKAIEWLAERFELGSGKQVVDLAAGTGKLTQQLLSTDARVIAVEPVAAMRAALLEQCSGAQVLDGAAEAIPLPAAVADAVTVAQAFHWFDGERALAEIHRVLKTRGKLALVWNVRDLEQPLQQAVERIFNRHRGETPSHRSGRWEKTFTSTTLFRLEDTYRARHVQRLDPDGLAARVTSTSFIAALPDAEREAVASEVRELARAEGKGDLEYDTEVLVYARMD